MYDTAERIRLVRQRAGRLRQKREKRSLRTLCALCLILSFALVQAFSWMTRGQGGASVQEMLGATLMFEDAGAYVLVGVLSFTAAVTITGLCLRHRYKKAMSRKDHVQQENSHLRDE
jgi:hypothetical protein